MPSAETQPTLPVPGMLTGQRVVPIEPIATALGFEQSDLDGPTLGQLIARIHGLREELKAKELRVRALDDEVKFLCARFLKGVAK